MCSAGETSTFPRIDPDHPLAQAAREVNDRATLYGLEDTLAWLGLGEAGPLAYLAEQRALRAIAANMGILMGEDALRDELVAGRIVETPLWRDMRTLLVGCYLDGFAIAWKARELALDTAERNLARHVTIYGGDGGQTAAAILESADRFATHDPGVDWPSEQHDDPVDAICAALDRAREEHHA